MGYIGANYMSILIANSDVYVLLYLCSLYWLVVSFQPVEIIKVKNTDIRHYHWFSTDAGHSEFLLFRCRIRWSIETMFHWNYLSHLAPLEINLRDILREIWKFSFRKMHAVCKMMAVFGHDMLTHCDRVTHICVRILVIIGSDNVLSPAQPSAVHCRFSNTI